MATDQAWFRKNLQLIWKWRPVFFLNDIVYFTVWTVNDALPENIRKSKTGSDHELLLVLLFFLRFSLRALLTVHTVSTHIACWMGRWPSTNHAISNIGTKSVSVQTIFMRMNWKLNPMQNVGQNNIGTVSQTPSCSQSYISQVSTINTWLMQDLC